MRASPIGLG